MTVGETAVEAGRSHGTRVVTGAAGGRILMLVPHEPDDDPRIRWVAALCADVGRTDILGTTWSTEKQAREYDGTTYLERVNIRENSSALARGVALVGALLHGLGCVQRYVAREGRRPGCAPRTGAPGAGAGGPTADVTSRPGPRFWRLRTLVARVDHQVGAVVRFVSVWAQYGVLISALYRRARAVSVIPRVIVCHDLFALLPAAFLKSRYRCLVIYDSHEFWPQGDLLAQAWETRLLTLIERALAKRVDAVITVSPPLARHMKALYGLPEVLSVPNAEPFEARVIPSCGRQPTWPVRFLLQGRVARGRGMDKLLETWSQLKDDRAVLWLRCPEDPYLGELRERFRDALAERRIVMLPPVGERELVSMAAEADVGIIPYVGPNLNHLYACPNKLSQYMHAGLAILSNRLEFIEEIVNRYGCGVTYDADDPDSLIGRVKSMISDLSRLALMKQHAYEAVRSEFNWAVQSQPYGQLLQRLYYRETSG